MVGRSLHREPAGALANPGSRVSEPQTIDQAVRDAATRATVAVGLGGLVAIHAVDAVGKWTETRYIFWMYVAAMIAAIGAAGWTLFTRSRVALLAAAGVAGSVLIGYIVTTGRSACPTRPMTSATGPNRSA